MINVAVNNIISNDKDVTNVTVNDKIVAAAPRANVIVPRINNINNKPNDICIYNVNYNIH